MVKLWATEIRAIDGEFHATRIDQNRSILSGSRYKDQIADHMDIHLLKTEDPIGKVIATIWSELVIVAITDVGVKAITIGRDQDVIGDINEEVEMKDEDRCVIFQNNALWKDTPRWEEIAERYPELDKV